MNDEYLEDILSFIGLIVVIISVIVGAIQAIEKGRAKGQKSH